MPLRHTIYACAFSILRREDEAADCTQDVVTRLWEIRSKLDAIDNLEAYCVTSSKRGAIDRLRSAAIRCSDALEDSPDLEDPQPPPDLAVEHSSDLEEVRSLMERLPAKQRQLLELSGIGGLSNDEIQEATGLSPENVRVILSRGRKRLRELFNKRR